jgi:hypothetical protein
MSPSRSTALPARLLLGLALALGSLGATADVPAEPAAPGPAAAACGNGILEPDETCEGCPADCRPGTCAAGAARTVTIDLTPQQGVGKVGAVGILLAYRPAALTVPGQGNEPAVSARVKPRAAGSQVWVNDLGYALRIGVSNASGLHAGPLVDVELAACDGAPAPGTGDVNCRVESCAFGGGRLRGCGCSVSVQPPATASLKGE